MEWHKERPVSYTSKRRDDGRKESDDVIHRSRATLPKRDKDRQEGSPKTTTFVRELELLENWHTKMYPEGKRERNQVTITEHTSCHCFLSGRQKSTRRRTPVLRKGSVIPLCRGKTLNFGDGRSTWNTSRERRDDHQCIDFTSQPFKNLFLKKIDFWLKKTFVEGAKSNRLM